MLFRAVDKFYDDKSNFDKLYACLTAPVATSRPKRIRRNKKNANQMKKLRPVRMSLKLIDYAVGVFALNGASVMVQGVPYSINGIYRAGMAAYGRTFYDAFRRYNTFEFKKHDTSVYTTVAQLAFFRDMIRYGVLDYITAHIVEIRQHMDVNKKVARRNLVRTARATVVMSNAEVPMTIETAI